MSLNAAIRMVRGWIRMGLRGGIRAGSGSGHSQGQRQEKGRGERVDMGPLRKSGARVVTRAEVGVRKVVNDKDRNKGKGSDMDEVKDRDT